MVNWSSLFGPCERDNLLHKPQEMAPAGPLWRAKQFSIACEQCISQRQLNVTSLFCLFIDLITNKSIHQILFITYAAQDFEQHNF